MLFRSVCIEGVKVKESPEWLRTRLKAIGLNPINNIVDITNFILFGKPIPHTSGMLEICRESNYDTYGEILPLSKIKRTVGDVLAAQRSTAAAGS